MSIRRMWIIGLVAFMLLTATAGNSGYVSAQTVEGNEILAFGDTWTGSNTTAGLTVINNGTGNGIRGYAHASVYNTAGLYGVNYGSGAGVYGRSDVGNGVYGKGTYGVWGESATANKAGVYGKNTVANGIGVKAATTGANGTAVYGVASGAGTAVLGSSDSGIGLWGGTNSANNAGVYALNGGTGPAVYALSGGIGVNALSTNNDGVVGTSYMQYKSGVYGVSTLALGYGVTGHSDSYFGMFADGYDAGGDDDLVGDLTLGGNFGEIFAPGNYFDFYSNGDVNFDLDNDNNSANSCFTIWQGNDTQLQQWCEGSIVSQAPQATAIQTTSEGQRLMYDVAGTGVWLEDVGTATLLDGELVIPFDTAYAQMANLTQAYQVFVTATCDQPVLLYVSEKTATSFTVKGANLDGSPSGCAFDYRVVAARVGYETVRLEQYTEISKDGE